MNQQKIEMESKTVTSTKATIVQEWKKEEENMSDEEISREMHLNRSTVFRNRKKALSKIKSYMENVRYD